MRVDCNRNSVCLTAMCMALLSMLSAGSVYDSPDLQAAQQKFDAGQYPDALRLISAGLNSTKPDDATGQHPVADAARQMPAAY